MSFLFFFLILLNSVNFTISEPILEPDNFLKLISKNNKFVLIEEAYSEYVIDDTFLEDEIPIPEANSFNFLKFEYENIQENHHFFISFEFAETNNLRYIEKIIIKNYSNNEILYENNYFLVNNNKDNLFIKQEHVETFLKFEQKIELNKEIQIN